MNVRLDPQLEEWVQQQVATGQYSDASEVVNEALQTFIEQDQGQEWDIESLRQAIQEGIDSGPSKPWEGAEEIIRKARSIRDAKRLEQQS